MKKNIIFSFLLAATMIFVGCEKNDGATDKNIAIDEVPQPSVVINGGSAAIDLTNLASFQGRFDVKLLYPNGIQPAKLDVVIRKNNVNTNIKLVQAGITTYPTTLTITAAQIATLFGTAISLGDNYDIGVDIYTTSGAKYEAFPVVGAAYGSTGVANQPGFSPTVRYSAICAYNPDIYQGNFVVVSDDFGDFVPGEIVVLTKISNTSFSFIDPYATSPLPIIVVANPLNNGLSVAKQKIGNAFTWNLAYTNPNAEVPVNAANSFASPCAQSFQLSITFTVDQGSFGPGWVLKMRKQ
jgi:hypothetical protein